MTNFLLDTTIISELTKPQPDNGVIDFVAALPFAWLSVITLHELDYGVALLPESKRKQQIQNVTVELVHQFSDYIVPVGQAEAQQAAAFRVLCKQQGSVLHLADSLIAGTAQVHGLTVVTQNIKDFEGLDLELHDPLTQVQ